MSMSDWLSEPEVLSVTDTDWMDGIRTIEEVADKNKVMAFCEQCNGWWGFELGVDPDTHPVCGSKYSQRIGYQLVSLRTFNPVLHGTKKLKKK